MRFWFFTKQNVKMVDFSILTTSKSHINFDSSEHRFNLYQMGWNFQAVFCSHKISLGTQHLVKLTVSHFHVSLDHPITTSKILLGNRCLNRFNSVWKCDMTWLPVFTRLGIATHDLWIVDPVHRSRFIIFFIIFKVLLRIVFCSIQLETYI